MKKILPLFICLLLLWACAAERPAIKATDVLPDNNHILPDREPSPEDLLLQAMTMLPLPGQAGQVEESRAILGRLIRLYPDSRWRSPAESLLLLIDRHQACRKKAEADLDVYNRLMSQKTKCEDSENQCRLDLTRILQENEQLKKDLQNLKNLEIELEQRNRRIR